MGQDIDTRSLEYRVRLCIRDYLYDHMDEIADGICEMLMEDLVHLQDEN